MKAFGRRPRALLPVALLLTCSLLGLSGCSEQVDRVTGIFSKHEPAPSADRDISALAAPSTTATPATAGQKGGVRRFWNKFVNSDENKASGKKAETTEVKQAKPDETCIRVKLCMDGSIQQENLSGDEPKRAEPVARKAGAELMPELEANAPVPAPSLGDVFGDDAKAGDGEAVPPAPLPEPEIEDVRPVLRNPELGDAPAKDNSRQTVNASEDVDFRYHIRSGDSLNISIPGEAGTARSVPVQPDGYVRYLYDIELLAAGKTYKQLHDELLVKLTKYYKNPRVTVIGESFKGNSVFVMGPVSNPGAHVINRGTKLLDVLSSAGVLSLLPQIDSASGSMSRQSDVVDLDGAYIARDDRVLEVDFRKLLLQRDLKNNNIPLKPGDFIFIPSSIGTEKKVYLCGRIDTPQVYYYTGSLSFMEAMLVAGGADTDASDGGAGGNTANARNCYIVRGKEKEPIKVDWPAIQMGKKPDIQLASGDIVYVPERALSYGSRVTTSVIREILAPLQSVIDSHEMTKNYYRREWQLPSRGKARLK
jgi:polysaccharide export outer membrane protein